MVEYSFMKIGRDKPGCEREPAMSFVETLVNIVDELQPFMSMKIEPSPEAPRPKMSFGGLTVFGHDAREQLQEHEFAIFLTAPTMHFETPQMKAASYNRVMVMADMQALREAAKNIEDKKIAVTRYAQMILREIAAAHEFYVYSNFSVPEELRLAMGSAFDFENPTRDAVCYEHILCGYGVAEEDLDLRVQDDFNELLERKRIRCAKYAALAFESIEQNPTFVRKANELAQALSNRSS